MRNHAIHNTIAVRTTYYRDQYTLSWVDDEGICSDQICFVFGLENAIRVANGIAHDQCEYVTHPAFNPDEVSE